MLTGGKEWGNAHDFLENLFFIYKRTITVLTSPLTYAWMSEGGGRVKTQPNPIFSFDCLTWLYSSLPFVRTNEGGIQK